MFYFLGKFFNITAFILCIPVVYIPTFYFMNKISNDGPEHSWFYFPIKYALFSFIFAIISGVISDIFFDIQNAKENGWRDNFRDEMRFKRINTYKQIKIENPNFDNLNSIEKSKLIKEKCGNKFINITKYCFKFELEYFRNIKKILMKL